VIWQCDTRHGNTIDLPRYKTRHRLEWSTRSRGFLASAPSAGNPTPAASTWSSPAEDVTECSVVTQDIPTDLSGRYETSVTLAEHPAGAGMGSGRDDQILRWATLRAC